MAALFPRVGDDKRLICVGGKKGSRVGYCGLYKKEGIRKTVKSGGGFTRFFDNVTRYHVQHWFGLFNVLIQFS